MTMWLLAGAGVCLALLPCAVLSCRGGPERRLVGVELTSLVITLALAIFAVAFGRMPFIDVALTSAVMSFGGGIVFARFLEKHL